MSDVINKILKIYKSDCFIVYHTAIYMSSLKIIFIVIYRFVWHLQLWCGYQWLCYGSRERSLYLASAKIANKTDMAWQVGQYGMTLLKWHKGIGIFYYIIDQINLSTVDVNQFNIMHLKERIKLFSF